MTFREITVPSTNETRKYLKIKEYVIGYHYTNYNATLSSLSQSSFSRSHTPTYIKQ